MKVVMRDEANADLEEVFDYYQGEREGLGLEFLDEFRHGVERILEHPEGWQSLDPTRRRYRMRRFPYGLIYRIEPAQDKIVILAVVHMSRHRQ